MPQSSIYGISSIVKNIGGTIPVDVAIISGGGGTLYAESKDLDFGESSRDKYIDMLVFDIESTGQVPTLACYVGHRNSLADEVTWENLGYLDMNNPVVYPDRIEARYIKIKIEDENPYSQWRLSKIEAFGRFTGEGRR